MSHRLRRRRCWTLDRETIPKPINNQQHNHTTTQNKKQNLQSESVQKKKQQPQPVALLFQGKTKQTIALSSLSLKQNNKTKRQTEIEEKQHPFHQLKYKKREHFCLGTMIPSPAPPPPFFFCFKRKNWTRKKNKPAEHLRRNQTIYCLHLIQQQPVLTRQQQVLISKTNPHTHTKIKKSIAQLLSCWQVSCFFVLFSKPSVLESPSSLYSRSSPDLTFLCFLANKR